MEEKKKRNNPLYLLTLILAVFLVICFVEINSLKREIDNMRYDYLSEDEVLRGEIHAIYDNVDQQMKEQASLFTGSEYSVGELDLETQKAAVTLQVVPKEIAEDMQMTVQLDGETAEFTKEGSSFKATLPVRLFGVEEPYALITITSGGITKTELLEEIYLGELWTEWLPLMHAEDTTGRTDYDDGTLTFDTEIQITYKASGQAVGFETFFLVTELNGKEIERKDITDDVKGSEDYEKGTATFALSDSYEVIEGDDLRIYVVAEDSLGYIHKALAHYWKKSNGAEAEAIYGGESIYDKQGNMVYGF